MHQGELGPPRTRSFQSSSWRASSSYSDFRKEEGSRNGLGGGSGEGLNVFPLLFQPRSQLGEHVGGHPSQVEFCFPSPILTGRSIVDGHGPRVGDLLSLVGRVLNLEFREMILDFRGEFPRGETHRREVVS